MSNGTITDITLVGCGALALAAYVGLILLPAWSAYTRTWERVAAAFNLVLSDQNVKAILVNIFAGINRCDWVAQGVVQAATGLRVPLVVRLAGTNVEEGRRIVRDCGLPIITADTLAEAAQKVVAVSRSGDLQ